MTFAQACVQRTVDRVTKKVTSFVVPGLFVMECRAEQ